MTEPEELPCPRDQRPRRHRVRYGLSTAAAAVVAIAGFNLATSNASHAASTVCVQGRFGLVEAGGTYTPLPAGIGYEIWESDSNGSHDLLKAGRTVAVTSANPNSFRDCNLSNVDSDESGTSEVYVKFLPFRKAVGGNVFKVEVKDQGTVKALAHQTLTKPGTTGPTLDMGNIKPTSFPDGWRIVPWLNSLYNWVLTAASTHPKGCWDSNDAANVSCTVMYAHYNTDPNSKTQYTGFALNIAPSGVRWPSVILHEAGHALMDDLYEGRFPSSDGCSPHDPKKVTTPECAWVEGFASWVGSMVRHNERYTSATVTWNWETATQTPASPPWASGDDVEGRVVGALWDLSDNANDGLDAYSDTPAAPFSPGPIFHTVLERNPHSFFEFWDQRGIQGFDVGPAALKALQQNTIVY